MERRLLEIRDLKVDLMTQRGIVYALQGVNMDICEGEIHGLVGESGCGKSMTSKAILHLLDRRRSRVSGSVLLEGRELIGLSEREMRKVRGNLISIVFQDPMISLNPLMTVGDQIAESYTNHQGDSRKAALAKAFDMLELVGIHPADRRMKQYPFELSGGLQQRVMIAMAAACRPKLLIADEPTTSLDVTIQAQILELFKELRRELKMSILMITHNFGIVAEICDRVSVMYAGRVIETASSRGIFDRTAHPYSSALIASIPKAGQYCEYLPVIPGSPPRQFEREIGCSFRPRCPYRDASCDRAQALSKVGEGHLSACTRAFDRG
ncbi:MAG: ABC transporter ATP-binding protein [Candidatus Excrementavichristensenella sp.]|jgi:peptide/nickel transport system ATP-binding protein